MTALDLVYQYRLLIGKCESGAGLDFDEIETLGAIESLFARTPADGEGEGEGSRAFAREPVDIAATLRGHRIDDAVHIVDLSPGGMVCRAAPYVEEDAMVEVVIEDEELALSYRFKAQVSWLRDDEDDYALGLRFVGTPVLIHRGSRRDHGVVTVPIRTEESAPKSAIAA